MTCFACPVARRPFPVRAIQVDGGSEFRGEFETACAERGMVLFVLPPRLPKLNGRVERLNGSWRDEFYGLADLSANITRIRPHVQRFAELYNNRRPHQSLKGQPPMQYLEANFPDPGLQPSHMS